MANRRELIKAGLFVTAGLANGLWVAPSEAKTVRPLRLRLERFVFDARFDEAAELARYVGCYDVPLQQTSGDMTELWYDHLAPSRPSPRIALAGITGADAFFVVERAAADHRMRLVYRGEHAPARDGLVAHDLSGPGRLVAEVAANAKPSLDAAVLARAMVACPAAASGRETFRTVGPASAGARRTEKLVSWIFAPRASAPGRA